MLTEMNMGAFSQSADVMNSFHKDYFFGRKKLQTKFYLLGIAAEISHISKGK